MPYSFHFLPCDSGPKFNMNLKHSTISLHTPRFLRQPEKYSTSFSLAHILTCIQRTQLPGEKCAISRQKISVGIFVLPTRGKDRKTFSSCLLCGNYGFSCTPSLLSIEETRVGKDTALIKQRCIGECQLESGNWTVAH